MDTLEQLEQEYAEGMRALEQLKEEKIASFIKGLFATFEHAGIGYEDVDTQDREDIESYCRRELDALL